MATKNNFQSALIFVLLILTSSISPSLHSVHGLSSIRGDVAQSDVPDTHFQAPSAMRRHLNQRRARSRRQSSLAAITTPLADIVPILGPRTQVDFIAVFDRSINVGKHEFFYYDRPIVEAILSHYATVDERYVRVAAVTFALDARVAFDSISSGVGLTKCQLFNSDNVGPPPVWNSVSFDDSGTEQYGRNITAALEAVIDIMTAGRRNRPTARQVVVMLTDGAYGPQYDPHDQVRTLQTMGVTTFVVGVGVWLQPSSCRSMASDDGNYYGPKEEWRKMLAGIPSSITSDVGTLSPVLSPLDMTMCGTTCRQSDGSRCFCDIDTAVKMCMCITSAAQNATTSNLHWSSCTVDTVNATSNSSGGNTGTANLAASSYCSNSTSDGSSACQNSGTCYDLHRTARDIQAIGGYGNACACPIGYSGRLCEIPEDDLCSLGPCSPNGTVSCVADRPGSYLCTCLSIYKGEFCEDLIPTTITTATSSTMYITADDNTTTSTSIAASSSSGVMTSTSPGGSTSQLLQYEYDVMAANLTTIEALDNANQPSTSDPIPAAGAAVDSNSLRSGDDAATESRRRVIIIAVVCSVGGAIVLGLLIAAILCLVLFARRRRRRHGKQYRVDDTPKISFGDTYGSATVRSTDSTGTHSETGGGGVSHQNDTFASDEMVLRNEVMSSPRTLSDWKVYLLELTTTGAIQGGIVAGIGFPDFVKTHDWTYSRQEIDDMAAAVSTTSSSAWSIHDQQHPSGPSALGTDANANSAIRIQGKDFRVVRQNDGQTLAAVHEGSDETRSTSNTSLTHATGGRRNTVVAAVGKSKKFIVAAATMDEATTLPVNSRCLKEVEWMVERMVADGM